MKSFLLGLFLSVIPLSIDASDVTYAHVPQEDHVLQDLHHLEKREHKTNIARKVLGADTVFLKLLLLGSQTYAWALEVGAPGASAASLSAAGTAGVVSSGSLGGVLLGGVEFAVALSMTLNLPTEFVIVGGVMAASAIAEQWKDRLEKTAVRMSALASIPRENDHLEILKGKTFTELAEGANKRRVKYHCKRTKAIKHARKGKIKDALFCIWNSPSPKDYLCEFLANLPGKGKNTDAIGIIAPIFKDVIINTYRQSLKYRFLDKYYTSINDDYEGMIKIRSTANIADRLNASEFWMPDSSVKLFDILQSMQGDSKLMTSLNMCHKHGCDDREGENTKKEAVFDKPANESYANYCEFYFYKKPSYAHSVSEYLKTSRKEVLEKRISNVNENLGLLFKEVKKGDFKQQTNDTLQSIEELSHAAVKYKALNDELKSKKSPSERQEHIKKWMELPENQAAYHTLKGASDRLVEEHQDDETASMHTEEEDDDDDEGEWS